jgi:hypothetical protein
VILVIVAVVFIIVVVATSLMLAAGDSISPRAFSVCSVALLWIAGILSGLMTLTVFAAAAWGMDTRVPWGLGVYMYLIPALSLPAFLLLKFSIRALSWALWLLTVSNAFAWFFGDRADRIASGFRLLSDPHDILGMFLNMFTLIYLMISLLVLLAEICRRKSRTETNPPQNAD